MFTARRVTEDLFVQPRQGLAVVHVLRLGLGKAQKRVGVQLMEAKESIWDRCTGGTMNCSTKGSSHVPRILSTSPNTDKDFFLYSQLL